MRPPLRPDICGTPMPLPLSQDLRTARLQRAKGGAPLSAPICCAARRESARSSIVWSCRVCGIPGVGGAEAAARLLGVGGAGCRRPSHALLRTAGVSSVVRYWILMTFYPSLFDAYRGDTSHSKPKKRDNGILRKSLTGLIII